MNSRQPVGFFYVFAVGIIKKQSFLSLRLAPKRENGLDRPNVVGRCAISHAFAESSAEGFVPRRRKWLRRLKALRRAQVGGASDTHTRGRHLSTWVRRDAAAPRRGLFSMQ